MDERLEKIQHNIEESEIKPLFADEIFIANNIKAFKDKKGKVHKEGKVVLIFVDMMNQKPINKVVLSPITARNLLKSLKDNLNKLDKELKKKGVSKKTKITKPKTGYIG